MYRIFINLVPILIIIAHFNLGHQVACLPPPDQQTTEELLAAAEQLLKAANQTLPNENKNNTPLVANSNSNATKVPETMVTSSAHEGTQKLKEHIAVLMNAINKTLINSNETKVTPAMPVNVHAATDTEVEDLKKPLVTEASPLNETKHTDEDLAKMVFTNDTFNKNINVVNKETDVAYIQTNGNEDDRLASESNTETDQFVDPLLKQQIILDTMETTPSNSVSHSQIPAIVAGIFVIMCVIGYTAMLTWRRFLEKRYGNREMLVNDEFDPSDLRHFSL